MDERARIPVSLPRDGPTQSYWQDPPDAIADLRTTSELPNSADVVIIGSGITGAAVAWNLLQADDTQNKKRTIVMLEARQACSGATGRNGGHTKAASYRSFLDHASTLGTPAAVKIASLELANIQAVQAFAREHSIPCDLSPCDTIDVIYDEAQWLQAHEAVAAMRAAFPQGDPVAEYTFYSREETEKKFYCHDNYLNGKPETLYGGVVYFAGSLSAYKFGVGVLKLCLAQGLNLQTHTPALGLTKHQEGTWKVDTPRGTIITKQVVLATNGYTAALVPSKFQGVIVPLRGQITAHRPGAAMPPVLPTTYSFIYDKGYEYMVPRPAGSTFAGDIVMGGGLVRAPEDGLDEYGTTDDTSINETISNYLRETTPRYFGRDWGDDSPEGRVRKEWTGIMGYSPDGFPLVGEVPGEKGLWASVSFQGHGMVLCWMCARALVEMMEGRDDDEALGDWFPEVFRVSEERLGKRFVGRLHTAAAAAAAAAAPIGGIMGESEAETMVDSEETGRGVGGG
ncbi:FAD dependent oxidoreductase-domain-containing protein [Apodospora peruviana]|uniref:FAD dependent oxidoreductase-domain-containing protein n=1 Tax=Apodospora peruviana TaxID=516989 RepID=A0AAE0M234_9PEZI|nr:FAD dependent oxidoreductase-domain-containing protein [Apodospora peruviana]